MVNAKGGRSKLITATKALALEVHRKRLKTLEGLIRRRLATVVESFYDIGEALAEILKKKLYAVGGHPSLEAYLAATKVIGIAQAMKLIAIVREVPREAALAKGMRAVLREGGLGATEVRIVRDEVHVVWTRAHAERLIERGA